MKTNHDNTHQLIGNSEKYENIIHQQDVWHGGKSIGKKVTNVSYHIIWLTIDYSTD